MAPALVEDAEELAVQDHLRQLVHHLQCGVKEEEGVAELVVVLCKEKVWSA